MSDQPNNEEPTRRAQQGDVVHDAFLRAYRQLGSLNDPGTFAAWIVRITRLVARERGRTRHFELLPQESPAPMDEEESGVEA